MLRQITRFVFLMGLFVVSVAAAAAPEATPTAGAAINAPPAPLPTPIPDSTNDPNQPPAAPDCGPDLVPYTPDVYGYPVTPNSVKNTTLDDSLLYSEKETYFDWYFANIGTAAAMGTFQVEVWVDGVRFLDYPFSGWPEGTYGGVDDWSYAVPGSGWLTVAMIVDADNAIAECDESNNDWEEIFYWQPVYGWWGQYYNNPDLAGDAVYVRDDPEIQFEWLSDSPAPGIVDADDFSVLWQRDVFFNAGTYLFQMSRDDGMRFWIDSGLLLDAWVQGVADDAVIADLTQGTHTLELAANDLGGWAVAKIDWIRCYSLDVSPDPADGGDVWISPGPNCGDKYLAGTVVSLTAEANSNYTFTNWSGGLTGPTNPGSVTMNGDRNVTAHFAPVCYSLTTTVDPTGSGNVSRNPTPNCAGGKYTAGTVVSLTAEANSNYTFTNWSGGLTGPTNPGSVTMNGDRSVTAHFAPVCYSLTTTVDPTGSGNVSRNPTPNCAGGKYTAGTVVSLTAEANSNYTFTNWSGGLTGPTNPGSVTMNGDRNVTAHFAPVCYSLTTTVDPTGSGNVSRNPTPNCAGGKYTAGTVVSLTAEANSNYTFTNWSGDLTGPTNPGSVTMNGDRSVTAHFAPVCYSLTTTVDPTGSGNVSRNPTPNCAGGKYTAGTRVDLTVAANGDYVFTHWSGDAQGSNPSIWLIMDGNKTVVAHFSRPTCYSVTTAVSPLEAGQVNTWPEPNCSGGLFAAGTSITLTADATADYEFDRWSGAIGGSANPRSISVGSDMTIIAHFRAKSPTCYPLTLNYTGSGNDPEANPTGSPGCQVGHYVANEVIALTARPGGGQRVRRWEGTDSDNTRGLTNTATMPPNAHTIMAHYESQPSAAYAMFIPLTDYEPCFTGEEQEPNNSRDTASGPICLGLPLFGRPSDGSDYYRLELEGPWQLNVALVNIEAERVQLQLYGTVEGSDPIAFDPRPPFQLQITLGPGVYYLRVAVDGQATDTVYTLLFH